PSSTERVDYGIRTWHAVAPAKGRVIQKRMVFDAATVQRSRVSQLLKAWRSRRQRRSPAEEPKRCCETRTVEKSRSATRNCGNWNKAIPVRLYECLLRCLRADQQKMGQQARISTTQRSHTPS